ILPRHFGLTVLRLTGIRRRTDIHVERALAVEGQSLVGMPALLGQRRDGFWFAGRFELSRRHLVSLNGRERGGIEIAIPQGDPRGAALPEGLLCFELAVTVRVTQRDDPAGRLSPERDIQIAVRRDDEMA